MRVNVYIPDDLHQEMKARPDINWSQVAQQAFRLTLIYQHPTVKRDWLLVATEKPCQKD